MIQLTLIQIDNYGPWTTHPLPKREAYLQMLQAEIYQTIQRMFSEKKALVFPMRYDNMMAITNGLGEPEHKLIMDAINKKFPVSISMSIAAAETPYEAQAKATKQLSTVGGAQHKHRKAILKASGASNSPIKIAHVDINDITKHTDSNVYDSYARVVQIERSLVKHFTPKGSLVFFMGGDNFLLPCGKTTKHDFLKIFKKIKKETSIALKAGIGTAKTAEEAVHLASMGLKEIRSGAKEEVIEKK